MAALLVAILFGRASFESYSEYALGKAASEELDWNSAIIHYRHALECYAPVGSAGRSALDRLVTIGDERAKAGDTETALFAYRSARVGIMAIRHLWIPHEDALSYLSERIAMLMSAGLGSDQHANAEAAEDYLEQLEDYPQRQVNPFFGMCAGLAFVVWLAGLTALIAIGFDKNGKPLRRLRWLVPSCLFLLIGWIVLVLVA